MTLADVRALIETDPDAAIKSAAALVAAKADDWKARLLLGRALRAAGRDAEAAAAERDGRLLLHADAFGAVANFGDLGELAARFEQRLQMRFVAMQQKLHAGMALRGTDQCVDHRTAGPGRQLGR